MMVIPDDILEKLEKSLNFNLLSSKMQSLITVLNSIFCIYYQLDVCQPFVVSTSLVCFNVLLQLRPIFLMLILKSP